MSLQVETTVESTARALAAQALAITSQDWTGLGFSDDPQVAPSSDVNVITERIVSLLAVRSVALVSSLDDFQDFSTTTICRTILLDSSCWPSVLSQEVVGELRAYVKRIIQGYQETPYHNREHAYHVTLSSNKLLDMMLNSEKADTGHEIQLHQSWSQATLNGYGRHQQLPAKIPKTYGLRRDTLLQFALVYAALIHDVQHGGISNRQLTLEDDALSLLYNDTSILEQQSLTIGFTELLQPEFAKFREAIFPSRDLYNGFRKTVVNLVLATDIASPERMQVTKDKWKTAFGDIEQNEDKISRESTITEITLSRATNWSNKESRRRSIGSIFSDITVDLNAVAETTLGDDEASYSATPESSENDIDHDAMGASGLSGFSGSFEGMETVTSDRFSRSSHFRSQTPDSAGTISLEKIEESDASGEAMQSEMLNKDNGGASAAVKAGTSGAVQAGTPKNKDHADEVDSQDLGYSTLRQSKHSDRTPRTRSPKHGVASSPASMSLSQIARSRANRRGSTTSVPEAQRGGNAFRRRRASMIDGLDSNQIKRMQRRLSSSSSKTTGDLLTGKFRQRLGIMRSVDLGGETIENFSRKESLHTASLGGGSHGKNKLGRKFPFEEYDEPDELRATVVLETMLLSCDVAHNLQGWDQMLKWSQKLYWELYDANEAGRGFDPAPGWVGGQTGFLQSYMMPIAKKLEQTGVFGNNVGPAFARILNEIIDLWEMHGEDVTKMMLNTRDVDLLAHRSKAKLPSTIETAQHNSTT